MIHGRDVNAVNSIADDDSDELTKRQRYIQQCKKNVQKRMKQEP